MTETTTNLHLVKPDYEDTADISVINSNMDIIDEEVAKRSVGANSSTNNGIALFDGAGGKTLKDSGKTITDSSSAAAMANDTNVPTNRTVRNAIYNELDKSSDAGFALDARQGYALNNKIARSGLVPGSNAIDSGNSSLIFAGHITGSGAYIDVWIPIDTSRVSSVTSVKLGSSADAYTANAMISMDSKNATELKITNHGVYAEFALGQTLSGDKNRVASLRCSSVTIVCT